DGVVSAAWTARSPDRATRDDDPARVDLLQGYDEYVMGHAMPRAYLQPPGIEQPIIPEYPLHAMLAGGTMIGRWAPVVRGGRATLRVLPWRELTPDEERSLEGRLAEVAAFLGVPADVERESVAAV
ncbi:MAG TPA: crosslink repair DNA glycosylase YcaQ family protein, partial [Agromyces sp.]